MLGEVAQVRRGHRLTVGCGLVDECCRVTPGALDDLLGVRIVRRLPGEAPLWRDDLTLTGAEVVLRRDDHPAVTEHRYGSGLVRYVATFLDDLTPWIEPS